MDEGRTKPDMARVRQLENLGRTPHVALWLVILGLLLTPMVPLALSLEWAALILGIVSWPHRLGKIACVGAALASLLISALVVISIGRSPSR